MPGRDITPPKNKQAAKLFGVLKRVFPRCGSGQFDREASQTRDCCVAKSATLRAARPDSSRRKERLFGMTIKLHQQRVEARGQVSAMKLRKRARRMFVASQRTRGFVRLVQIPHGAK